MSEQVASFVEGDDKHPWDICECGDYRSDHENGTGRCQYGYWHTPFNLEFRECRAFKFAWRSSKDEAAWRSCRESAARGVEREQER